MNSSSRKRIGLYIGSAGSNSGGPERYETELLRSIAAIDKGNQYEIFCLFKDGPAKIAVVQDNFRYHTLWPSYRAVSMLTSLPVKLFSQCLDFMHATFIPPPITPHDYVFTLVCSSMFERPEFYPLPIRLRLVALMGLAVRQAKLIICLSQHIQEVVRERFELPPERTTVIPLAANTTFCEIPAVEGRAFLRQRYGIDAPYFLFSGRWERRKNIVRILEAFHRFKSEDRSPLKLVLSGERTWAAKEAEETIRRNKMEDEIVDLGKSPVDELPQLYAGAQALIYTSLWEGFGMPILEAMGTGTPVITSNNSAMAEIGANAALLVDPLSVDDIATAMHSIVADPVLHADLRARGLERAKMFSWENTARQTLAAYRRLETFKHGS
jgi:glycosyltransferase involved in cell wall biosynthesis